MTMASSSSIDYSIDSSIDEFLRKKTTFSSLMRPDDATGEPNPLRHTQSAPTSPVHQQFNAANGRKKSSFGRSNVSHSAFQFVEAEHVGMHGHVVELARQDELTTVREDISERTSPERPTQASEAVTLSYSEAKPAVRSSFQKYARSSNSTVSTSGKNLTRAISKEGDPEAGVGVAFEHKGKQQQVANAINVLPNIVHGISRRQSKDNSVHSHRVASISLNENVDDSASLKDAQTKDSPSAEIYSYISSSSSTSGDERGRYSPTGSQTTDSFYSDQNVPGNFSSEGGSVWSNESAFTKRILTEEDTMEDTFDFEASCVDKPNNVAAGHGYDLAAEIHTESKLSKGPPAPWVSTTKSDGDITAFSDLEFSYSAASFLTFAEDQVNSIAASVSQLVSKSRSDATGGVEQSMPTLVYPANQPASIPLDEGIDIEGCTGVEHLSNAIVNLPAAIGEENAEVKTGNPQPEPTQALQEIPINDKKVWDGLKTADAEIRTPQVSNRKVGDRIAPSDASADGSSTSSLSSKSSEGRDGMEVSSADDLHKLKNGSISTDGVTEDDSARTYETMESRSVEDNVAMVNEMMGLYQEIVEMFWKSFSPVNRKRHNDDDKNSELAASFISDESIVPLVDEYKDVPSGLSERLTLLCGHQDVQDLHADSQMWGSCEVSVPPESMQVRKQKRGHKTRDGLTSNESSGSDKVPCFDVNVEEASTSKGSIPDEAMFDKAESEEESEKEETTRKSSPKDHEVHVQFTPDVVKGIAESTAELRQTLTLDSTASGCRYLFCRPAGLNSLTEPDSPPRKPDLPPESDSPIELDDPKVSLLQKSKSIHPFRVQRHVKGQQHTDLNDVKTSLDGQVSKASVENNDHFDTKHSVSYQGMDSFEVELDETDVAIALQSIRDRSGYRPGGLETGPFSELAGTFKPRPYKFAASGFDDDVTNALKDIRQHTKNPSIADEKKVVETGDIYLQPTQEIGRCINQFVSLPVQELPKSVIPNEKFSLKREIETFKEIIAEDICGAGDQQEDFEKQCFNSKGSILSLNDSSEHSLRKLLNSESDGGSGLALRKFEKRVTANREDAAAAPMQKSESLRSAKTADNSKCRSGENEDLKLIEEQKSEAVKSSDVSETCSLELQVTFEVSFDERPDATAESKDDTASAKSERAISTVLSPDMFKELFLGQPMALDMKWAELNMAQFQTMLRPTDSMDDYLKQGDAARKNPELDLLLLDSPSMLEGYLATPANDSNVGSWQHVPVPELQATSTNETVERFKIVLRDEDVISLMSAEDNVSLNGHDNGTRDVQTSRPAPTDPSKMIGFRD